MLKDNKKFIRDNIILSLGLFLNGAFAYIFHFIMGRTLGPTDYGELNTIIAINYIILVFFNTIQMSITQFTARYKAKEELGKINNLIRKSTKKMLRNSIIASLVFSLTIPLLGGFLNLKNPLILLWTVPIIIISLIYPITRGALQGLQKFSSLSISYIGEGSIKVLTGLIMIILGLRVNGAIAAIGLGLWVSYIFTFKPLGKILKTKTEKINKKEVYSYSIPVLITILLLSLMYSLDILLVKHFLAAKEAGYYSALAILGKIIFFSITPFVYVMFPKVTEANEKNKNHRSILYKSLTLSLLVSLMILMVYFGVPNLAVGILFGESYLGITSLLGMMGVMMTFFSLGYVLCFYNMSLKKTGFIWIIALFALAEVIAIVLFHNTLFEIIRNLTVIMLMFLISMTAYSIIKK